MVKVSILTTYRSGRGDLGALKKSLRRQTFKDFEIVVHHDKYHKTFSYGFNQAFKRSKGEYIIFTEADCIWNSPYLLGLIVKSIKKGQATNLKDAGMECFGIHRDDFIPFDESLYVAEDTKWVSDLRKNGVKIVDVLQHNRKIEITGLWRAFVYPFEYFYPGTVMTPSHIIVRDAYNIARNSIELIMVVPAVLYSTLKEIKRKLSG